MAKRILLPAFIIMTILFAAGIYHIFTIRFSLGDVYPHYSSLRSDPMGTKIFYEGLANLPGYAVERDHSTVATWEGSKNTTLFILGLNTGMDHSVLTDFGTQNYNTLSALLSSGTRLVISLHPEVFSIGPISIRNKPVEKDKKEKSEPDTQDKDEEKGKKKDSDFSLLKKWGFNIDSAGDRKETMALLVENPENSGLPASIKFPSFYFFTDLDNRWTVHYTLSGKPVIISRQYGGGTLILCADSYIFSNEAMIYDRYPGLLSWIIGPANHVYFDESHLGLQHNIGIIDLAYKYRLQGVLLIFILIAVLFIWKNATHFIPPQENDDNMFKGIKAERDHLDGLVSLLKRHVGPQDLVKTCIAEWENASAKGRACITSNAPSVKELEDIASAKGSVSMIYNSICKKLAERKRI
ncbi:MAG: hypothetical protein JXL81_02640 [Deltaproteobacteria bacterium]|nr:hypothetical protein [Deltaproteobacteria bacterium]